MSARAKTVLGFCLAGVTLVAIADVAPRLAVGTAAVIGLGVALTHSQDIANLLNTWTSAVKSNSSSTQ